MTESLEVWRDGWPGVQGQGSNCEHRDWDCEAEGLRLCGPERPPEPNKLGSDGALAVLITHT